MNIETVNELIQSLDSAGELSIKETKVMALAKSYVQLVAENVGLKAAISAVNRTAEECEVNGDELKYAVEPSEFEALTDLLDETTATDRIVAGIKAEGAVEREKTIIFTAAKKRTQDGVALIAIGKPYKIHNDEVIGEFFIGERGRYGVITIDRLNYFATSDEYAWEFSLREGADK